MLGETLATRRDCPSHFPQRPSVGWKARGARGEDCGGLVEPLPLARGNSTGSLIFGVFGKPLAQLARQPRRPIDVAARPPGPSHFR
jgi:hypothetical protein